MFASKSVFLKEDQSELLQELLGFKEHALTTKDTLDALRWATEDIYSPLLEYDDSGEYYMPDTTPSCDWETGEIIYN